MATRQTRYTAQSIIRQLNDSVGPSQFPAFDGGTAVPADARLTVYRDDRRWAMVIEMLVFFPPSPGHWGIVDMPYVFGNCLTGDIGFVNRDSIQITSDGPDAPVFLPPIGLSVNPEARSIRIRGQVVPLDLSPAALKQKGIRFSKKLGLQGEHVVWSLLPEHRDALLATEKEKRRRLPKGLPKFMQLEEWNHPPLFDDDGMYPSESETFCTLADAIEKGDPACYRPKLRPNTHWRKWLGCERV